jgi:cholest-4-en-3-one 26-monooxygenase
VDVAGIDLFDAALFRDGAPHEVFDRLRAEAPVYWSPHEDDPDGGFWALTRHADVVALSRDPARFTSTQGIAAPRIQLDNPAYAENVIYQDPPKHTQNRKTLNRSFTPRAMVDLEDGVRRITVQVLDEVRGLDEFDWVEKVAAEIPARVVASVVGVPDEDHGKIVEWAGDLFARDGTPETAARHAAARQALMAYAEAFKAHKRSSPGDDAMSLLLQAEMDGRPLSETALTMWFFTLAQAGFETTHTLIAQSMVLLSERPDIRDRLLRDRDAIPRAVEELLRFITPVNLMARTAVEDVEVGGQVIRAGQYVTMWYAAANRDPAVFDTPHEVDIDRTPNNHLAFGGHGSPHYCLGAHLARLEMRVLLEELAARGFPFEVAGPAVRSPGVFINALARVPVASRSAA